VISPNAIDFDGDHCEPNSGFKIKRVKTAPILKDYYGVIARAIRDEIQQPEKRAAQPSR